MPTKTASSKAAMISSIMSEIDSLNKEAAAIEAASKSLQIKIYKTQSKIYEYVNETNQRRTQK